MTLGISETQHYTTIMLSVIMLIVIILNVIMPRDTMLSVSMLSVIMQSFMAENTLRLLSPKLSAVDVPFYSKV
jgi:hypothetical protein